MPANLLKLKIKSPDPQEFLSNLLGGFSDRGMEVGVRCGVTLLGSVFVQFEFFPTSGATYALPKHWFTVHKMVQSLP